GASEPLVESGDVIGALTFDDLRGTHVAFEKRIHKARPHPGQLKTAENLRRMLEGSGIRESHRDCARVQDAYSLRCMPQVHGALRDTLAHCREVMETEVNSAVDNPLVFARPRAIGDRSIGAVMAAEGDVLSSGNFDVEPVASALDVLGILL